MIEKWNDDSGRIDQWGKESENWNSGHSIEVRGYHVDIMGPALIQRNPIVPIAGIVQK